MKLADKLRRLATDKAIATSKPAQQKSPDLAEILGGRELHNAFGSFHLVENRYPLMYRHGSEQIRDILDVDCSGMCLLTRDEQLASFDLSRALFLDTETTGLAGGTGTYAFLVGIGRFVEGEFVVKQFLMRDYHEEVPQLAGIQQELEDCSGLVTFNGKRFDWPLLKDRFTLARIDLKCRDFTHVDLLHPARRLWKDRLTTCALTSLESSILDVCRTGDIPGSEVPQRFFDFVQSGRGELLQDVLTHNVIDILSMVSLFIRLESVGIQAAHRCTCPYEAAGLAKIFGHRKDWATAIQYYESAALLSKDRSFRLKILSQLALMYRRLQQWDQAELLWLALADEVNDLVACEELAKYYEHRKRDIRAARSVTKRGLAIALKQQSNRIKDFEYRLARLEAKMGKLFGAVGGSI